MRNEIRQGQHPADRYGHERNDCTVNALCNVTGNTYPTVHAYLKAAGRKDRRGFYTYRHFGTAGKRALGHKFIYVGFVGQKKKPTAIRFARTHRAGRYLICTRSHALCVVDGRIIDSARAKPRARIRSAWRVEPLKGFAPAPAAPLSSPAAPALPSPALKMRKVARGHFRTTIAVTLSNPDGSRRVLADLEILSGRWTTVADWTWKLTIGSLIQTGRTRSLNAAKALFAFPDVAHRNWRWTSNYGWIPTGKY
jgi:hypothetical protein